MDSTASRFLSSAIALGIFLAAIPHFARTQAFVFEAATVKPNNSGSGNSGTQSTNGLLRITNQTLSRMIQYAYNVWDFEISGGPAWVRSDRYDVTAKPDGSVRDQQMRQMLQALLAERFQLQFHRQTQEGPIYALLIGKNGPKLQPVPESSDNSGISSNSTSVRTTMKATRVTMEELAASLGNRVGRPVIDKTGLSGKFDFELSWAPDLTLDTGTPDRGADSGPSIFTALQEQLGLRLDSQKGPIEMFLIDRVEKPTED